MAPHPNILKAKKQRAGGRRAYLTSVYSLIHVPRSVGKSGIPEDAQPLFNYRDRALGGYDPWLDAIFPGVRPQPSDWNAEGADKYGFATNVGERNGRKFSLSRAEQEKLLAFVEHEEVCGFHTVKDSPLQQKRLTIVYSRPKTVAYLVEVHYPTRTVRRSKTYYHGGYDRALFDAEHNRHKIDWRDELTLESLTLVLPRRV